MVDERIDLSKYAIKREETDLESSLKLVDKELINEKLKELSLNNVGELKEYIIDDFKAVLELSKDDQFTKIFFTRLINNENSFIFIPHESDVETFMVFVYKKSDYYSYYIPDEIKKIINETF